MVIHKKDKLTAAEVRKLPVGTRVDLHGYDRRGTPQWLECTVAQSYRKKVLSYRNPDGTKATKEIRDYPNKYYTLKEPT